MCEEQKAAREFGSNVSGVPIHSGRDFVLESPEGVRGRNAHSGRVRWEVQESIGNSLMAMQKAALGNIAPVEAQAPVGAMGDY